MTTTTLLIIDTFLPWLESEWWCEMSVKFVVHFPFYVNEIKSERRMPENEMGVLWGGGGKCFLRDYWWGIISFFWYGESSC
jgi:hypothetical protein